MTIWELDEHTRLKYAVQIAAGLAAAVHTGHHAAPDVARYVFKLVDALLEEANK